MTKRNALLVVGCLGLFGCKEAIPTQADYQGKSLTEEAAGEDAPSSSCAKTVGFWQGEAGQIVIQQSGAAFLIELAGQQGRATFNRRAAAYCQDGVLVSNQEIIGNVAYNERDSNLFTGLGSFYAAPQ